MAIKERLESTASRSDGQPPGIPSPSLLDIFKDTPSVSLSEALSQTEPPAQVQAPTWDTVTVTLGTPNIDGPLRPELVTQVFRRRQNQLKYCYERALNQDPSLSGSLTARVVINTNGVVESVTSEDQTIDSTVADCVSSRLKRMAFPAPPLSTTIWLPVTFSTH